MRIRVINPNTTAAMTAVIGRCARAVAAPGTVVEAVTSPMGPASIESHYDEALAVPGLLAEIARGEAEGVDGYVIACFGDPGLSAARELARGPVLGIAEAAMRTATHLGRGFSVVTTLARTVGQAVDLTERYGVQRFCRGVHATDIPVLELEDPKVRGVIADACRAAVAADDSDAVVLGCAGMADLCHELSDEIGVPVIDGVAAATVTVQSLVTLGLRKSGRGEFASPPPKRYTGLLSEFATDGAES
ncbi:aspartate/glutamate racemase family protein [Nocardia terpenica]|uniref:Asp/Glu racemase n=1 Tax=Nocardia terpenica TaxID=455432 RepID=A0A164P695_9NOCA|nr:aspartate/glutamate racemase family protein [Nocardia terpenica]KZM75176.1 Asp/Glu racemase [Nocardia terpenica]MBF6065249.1 aspartate/glutamate racemase family protein [Nocardia terpenica]MBF6107976.1 aspartate/glutamate racemase family protein [Nocardia terpenica]MBF6115493.1 aspartate/glutamate racemase family protein [Nocardia terpenica]MBF6121930.1 aspartate/glutamate racemase family protein [Nocardia terpenica]